MTAPDRLVYWQRRARNAERIKAYTEAEMEANRRWMQHCFDEERRLAKRCEFLYGVAMAHGATHEELRAS